MSMYSPAVTPGTTPPANGEGPPKKKKRVNNGMVYSQPQAKGTGTQLGTQLHFAVEFLKKHRFPIRIEDWGMQSGVTMTPDLVQMIKSHDAIEFNERNHLYSYRGEHSLINTRAALLQAIKTSARDGKGLHIREIRDSWPGVVAEIDQLEKEGRIFATRTTKDNQPKTIFWNEMTEEEGGRPVDKEFQDIWNNLKVPPEADLLKSLATDGLQAAIAAPASGALPGNGKKKGKKSAHRIRQAKITNTHLEGIDVSKAYKPAEQN